MEINGIAHLTLSVADFEAAAAFYGKLLPFFGLKKVFDGKDLLYHVGGRTGVAIQRCPDAFRGTRFEQGRVGLHHVCFRARERGDVDIAHQFVLGLGATIVYPPKDQPWGPGYYSFLFEDPDGIRIEVNHVPGKGLFVEGAKFDPASDYR
jgi:catechol 2,3-dioxygenase-like lactoylglutathione lyase family enzyme